MPIPFVDLKRQYLSIKEEVDSAVHRVLMSGNFAHGEEVEAFEEVFSRYIGARYCVAVSSGTAALYLALMACGIGPGDEVITAPNTFIATAEAISTVGGRPVLVDVNPASYTMDPLALETVITRRTKAILPVHLYGQPADMDPILEIAKRYHLLVIEDACQAHGAKYKGRRVGSLGEAGCFSFYPTKNLGACGEGGAVLTDNLEIARKVRMLRDHGSDRKYYHKAVGFNCRMEAIQAAVLKVKLEYLDEWNTRRRQHAQLYSNLLSGTGLILPLEMPYAYHVFHLYVVQSTCRDELQQALADEGIATGIHYPVPIYLQEAYQHLGDGRGKFPVAERVTEHILSLPLYPEMSDGEVQTVSRQICKFLPH